MGFIGSMEVVEAVVKNCGKSKVVTIKFTMKKANIWEVFEDFIIGHTSEVIDENSQVSEYYGVDCVLTASFAVSFEEMLEHSCDRIPETGNLLPMQQETRP